MDGAVVTRNLAKKFRREWAVEELDLVVPHGSILGFLGPNGAGKTTTLKMIMNLLHPSGGSSEVLGVPSNRLTAAKFREIGYISENQVLPAWMTIDQLMEYCRPMYPAWDHEFESELAGQFELPMTRKIKDLSRGMKMKAALLSVLSYRPRLLILDEPFTGLDPLVRDELIRGLLEISDQKDWTVIVSSHDIEEVERLADRIAFISEGRLRFHDSTEHLQSRFRRVEVVTKDTAVLPGDLPTNWLEPEAAGSSIRFYVTDFDEAESPDVIRSKFPESKEVIIHTIPLRELFLICARNYRALKTSNRQ